MPATTYQTIVSAVAQGTPTEMDPGEIFGYFIWQDPENRWFLQATTQGEERRFTGTIETNGALSDVKTLSSQRSDGTVADAVDNRINFAFKTGGSNNNSEKMSGLSFLVNDGAYLNFRLFVDGQPVEPKKIFLGRENKHSSSSTIKIYSSNQ